MVTQSFVFHWDVCIKPVSHQPYDTHERILTKIAVFRAGAARYSYRFFKVARLPQRRRLIFQHAHYFYDFLTDFGRLKTVVRQSFDRFTFSRGSNVKVFCVCLARTAGLPHKHLAATAAVIK
jgi:hypothetical protein